MFFLLTLTYMEVGNPSLIVKVRFARHTPAVPVFGDNCAECVAHRVVELRTNSWWRYARGNQELLSG